MFQYFNKGISTPIAIGIILILAIAIGALIYFSPYCLQDKEWTDIGDELKEKEDETADWKVYTKTNYLGSKCSIKYPDDWQVKENYLSPKEKDIPEDIWVAIYCFSKEDGYVNPNTGEDLLPLCQTGKFSLSYTEQFEAVNSRQFCVLSTDGSKVGIAAFQVRGGRQRMDYYISDDEIESELSIFDQMLSTFEFIRDGEIKIGKVKIDYEEMEKIQQSVNEGHQPWRMSPLMVIRAEMYNFGFDPEKDFESINPKEDSHDYYEMTHDGKVYIIILTQPFPETGNIWTISEVRLK